MSDPQMKLIKEPWGWKKFAMAGLGLAVLAVALLGVDASYRSDGFKNERW